MSKQAMGTIGINQYERMDGLIYTLVYPSTEPGSTIVTAADTSIP
jgi:hypothetical protein